MISQDNYNNIEIFYYRVNIQLMLIKTYVSIDLGEG